MVYISILKGDMHSRAAPSPATFAGLKLLTVPFTMPDPEHDKIVDAFVRAGGVAPCNRGDPTKGYTHVHGPSCPAQPAHCTNHVVVVARHGAMAQDCALYSVISPCAPRRRSRSREGGW
jgi:hypothetical protein